jgi:hypothetical protein
MVTVAVREDNEKSSVVGLLATSGSATTTTSGAMVRDEEQRSGPGGGGRAVAARWVRSDPDAIWFGSNGRCRGPDQRVPPVRGTGQWIPPINDATSSWNHVVRTQAGKGAMGYVEN